MKRALTLELSTVDTDYLDIDIRAAQGRFVGSALLQFLPADILATFADAVAGFPTSAADSRAFAFERADLGEEHGYCRLDFRCLGVNGKSVVAIDLRDDRMYHEPFTARFSAPIFPAELDQFVREVRQLDRERKKAGVASLPFAV